MKTKNLTLNIVLAVEKSPSAVDFQDHLPKLYIYESYACPISPIKFKLLATV